MNTAHSPQDKGAAAGSAAGASAGAGASGFGVASPPPGFSGRTYMAGASPITLLPDQFERFLDLHRQPQQVLPQVAPVADPSDVANVNSVSVKLPNFWCHDPELWFIQAEAVFATRNPRITRDETKFNFVLMTLPAEALNSLSLIHI